MAETACEHAWLDSWNSSVVSRLAAHESRSARSVLDKKKVRAERISGVEIASRKSVDGVLVDASKGSSCDDSWAYEETAWWESVESSRTSSKIVDESSVAESSTSSSVGWR